MELPGRYSRRITSARDETRRHSPSPPSICFSRSFAPSLPFRPCRSHSTSLRSPSRLGQCQNSGTVRRDGNPSWSEFPTPTRPCALHIPAQAARVVRACVRARPCAVVNRVHPRALALRRADLCARMHRQLCYGRAFRCIYVRVVPDSYIYIHGKKCATKCHLPRRHELISLQVRFRQFVNRGTEFRVEFCVWFHPSYT